MSDPRPTTRGSRTAAVVMLVVFVQVLIVAILGLGAIGRDRQEARDEARRSQVETANTFLQKILDEARSEVLAALSDVRSLEGYADLEGLRADRFHGKHADLIKTVLRVDPENGAIYSMDGAYRLWVPDAVRADMIDRSKSAKANEAAEGLFDAYKNAPRFDWAQKITLGLKYAHAFPYRVRPGTDYKIALGIVGGLVRRADDAAQLAAYEEDQDAAYELLEAALLTAIEIVALNEDDEVAVGDRAELTEVPKQVEAAVAAHPEREAIRHRVQGMRQAREYLRDKTLRAALKIALDRAPDLAVDPDSGAAVVSVGRWLFGVIPGVRAPHATGTHHLLVLMSQEAAVDLFHEVAKPSQLERLGFTLEVPRNEGGEMRPFEDDVAAARDLRQERGLKTPHSAILRWKTPPKLPKGGPGEFFYWGIIALSAAGLIAGGWVLMRIYTREVRLARLKADFVSNLSHELKTPLTSIAMWTEMLADERMTDEEDRNEALGILTQESDRLQGIVKRMLDTAKREARGNTYDLEPGDLNEVVHKAAERFPRIVTEPGLDLHIELAPEPLFVRMEAAAIDDLVSNLVSNAWKYKDGEEARVEVRTRAVGRRAELTVADDGLGIPRRERRKVFEMFYRADAYLTRAAGTGLGLSLVRTIVRGHKGAIRVETGLNGRGTLFRIRIPLLRGAERRAAAGGASLGTMSPPPEAQFTP